MDFVLANSEDPARVCGAFCYSTSILCRGEVSVEDCLTLGGGGQSESM